MSEDEYKYIEEKARTINKSVSETIRTMLNMWRYLMEQPLISVIKSYSELKVEYDKDESKLLDALRRSGRIYIAEVEVNPKEEEEESK